MQAKNLERKLPWLKYDQKRLLYEEAKEKEKDAKRRLHEAAIKSNTLKKPME